MPHDEQSLLQAVREAVRIHATNKIAGRIMFCFKCLDPGSGRKIPAIRHGAGHIPLFVSQKPSTDNGINRPAILFSAWTGVVRCRM